MFIFKNSSCNMNSSDAYESSCAPCDSCALNNVFDLKDTAAKTVSFLIIALLNFHVRIMNPVVIKAAGAIEA